jgi:hypothetical protein
MPTLNRIVVMLEEQRRQLLDQLAAVDKAIAALNSAAEVAPVEDVATPVVPRRVESKRVLTDAHKDALKAGGRKARAAKEAAKGLAREMPDDGFVPAIGTHRDNHVPRLVKHPHKT